MTATERNEEANAGEMATPINSELSERFALSARSAGMADFSV